MYALLPVLSGLSGTAVGQMEVLGKLLCLSLHGACEFQEHIGFPLGGPVSLRGLMVYLQCTSNTQLLRNSSLPCLCIGGAIFQLAWKGLWRHVLPFHQEGNLHGEMPV